MLSQEEVCQKLLDFEFSVLNALATDVDDVQYEYIRELTTLVGETLSQQQAQGELSLSTLQLGIRVRERLDQLRYVLHEQRHQVQRIQSDTNLELTSILRRHIHTGSSPVYIERRDTTLNASFMRDWFLRNLGHPFPTREDKQAILAGSNARIRDRTTRLRYNQVVLWFINTRRRCGWTSFLRKYANGNKDTMADIAWALQEEQGGTHETRAWSAGPTKAATPKTTARSAKEANILPAKKGLPAVLPHISEDTAVAMRTEWEQMVERVRYGIKERIGDWMDEVIRDTHSSASEERRGTPRK